MIEQYTAGTAKGRRMSVAFELALRAVPTKTIR